MFRSTSPRSTSASTTGATSFPASATPETGSSERVSDLARAAPARVPVFEHAVRVVLPDPSVNLVEGRQTVPVPHGDELERLAEKPWRRRVSRHLPCALKDDVFRRDETELPVRERLVYESLGLRGIQYGVTEGESIRVV